ncbi:MAG TPA: AAA family ATPase [Candidatus Nanoarchaeia archaeon]|nr:AAA family ATPase [Candidatus Nanoarchaeia archaeon]
MGKSIGILSLKGGVGKTSSVIALGDAISDFGKKVLLVDANFSSPNLGLFLNVIDPEITLHHALNRTGDIRNAVHELPNFDILPSDIFHKNKISPMNLKNRLSPLKKNYDYILIDSSPSLNEETLGAMIASDELIVITTPDIPSLVMTIKAVNLAKKRGTPIAGVVLNKVYNRRFELPLKDIEETLEVPIMAVIPHDINVLEAHSNNSPLTSYRPKSEASKEYKKLAASLIGERYNSGRIRDIFRNVIPNKQTINRELYYNSLFG